MESGSAYFEMYYEPKYKRNYYYNPKTKESIWELPEGALCVDMTKGESQKSEKANSKEEEAKKSYKTKQEEIQALQKQNMEMMYPEYYKEMESQPSKAEIERIEEQIVHR